MTQSAEDHSCAASIKYNNNNKNTATTKQKQKSLTLDEKCLKVFWKKVRRMDY